MHWFDTPWTEVRDHKVVFIKKEMPPIWITEYQALSIRNHSWLWITIHEDPTNQSSPVLYDWKKSNIDQIIPVDWKKLQEIQWMRYINDFWESHLVIDMDNDDSQKRYKCPWLLFQLYMELKFGFVYAQDITAEKRKLFLEWVKDKTFSSVTNTIISEIKKMRYEKT